MLRIWEKLKHIFRLSSNITPERFSIGSIFYVKEGTFRNRFIVHTKKREDFLDFLLLPEAENITIPYKDCLIGINGGIIEQVETLPKKITTTCITQYEQNSYSHNRRQ